MNKWLLSNQVADNWNKGLQELRTNLSIELPGAHESPSYAALHRVMLLTHLIIHHSLQNINL